MKIGIGIGIDKQSTFAEIPLSAPVNIGQPFLTGFGAVGVAVICNDGSWTGNPTPTYTYDFRLDSVSVQNSSSNSYTPLLADDGKTLTCLVTATNSQGSASEGTSNSLVIGVAPSNTVAPTLSPSGTQSTGTVITVGNGTFSGTAPLTYAYRWKRNGSIILGETANTYTIVAGDDGTVITAEVKAINAYGESAYIGTSNQVDAVNAVAPSNVTAPVISGTEVVGQTLSSTTGTWTGIPTPTFSYQWYRGATLISGATSSTYTLVQADAGNTSNIKCVVTATNSAGSASTDSNTVAQILTVRTNSFLTASGINDATIRGGLNTFDIGLISNSLATKMKAVYPFVGGTASTHRWNFMDARDLDAAFRLEFFGGLTHDSNGVTGNGTNGYFGTKLNDQSQLGLNDVGVYAYSRTNLARAGDVLVATFDAVNNAIQINPRNGADQFASRCHTTNLGTQANADSRGLFGVNRTSSTNYLTYRNTTSTTINEASTATQNSEIYGLWNQTSGIFSQRNICSLTIGNGLNSTEQTNLYNLIQALQTTLGRQV